MVGFITSNGVPQAPDTSASQGYLNETPVGEMESQHAMEDENATTSTVGRFLSTSYENIKGALTGEQKLSPDEVNKQYAPIGPDGSAQKIAEQPMYPEVAKIYGKAKSDELDRQGILSRWAVQNPNNFPEDLAKGLNAFIHDPLNAASLFIPAVGEETVLAGMGRAALATEGELATGAARAVAGGTSAAIAQAPLTAIRYGEGTEWNSDYNARSALKDMFFAAAGGAIMHAGFGAAADALKTKSIIPEENIHSVDVTPPPPPPSAASQISQISDADVTTKNSAMRSAISQIIDGRPVDVDALFPVRPSSYNIMSPEGALIRPEDKLSDFEHFDSPKLTPDQESARGNQQEWLKQWDNEKTSQNIKNAEWQKFSYQFDQNLIRNSAERQQELYKNGWSPNMSQTELADAGKEIMDTKEPFTQPESKLPPTHVPEPIMQEFQVKIKNSADGNGVSLNPDTANMVAQKVAEEKIPAPEEKGVVGAIKGAINKVSEAVGLKEKPPEFPVHPDDEKISALEQKLDTSKMTAEERALLDETKSPYQDLKNKYESGIKALADCMGTV